MVEWLNSYITKSPNLQSPYLQITKSSNHQIISSPNQIDYLILGQGICGTFLSYYLIAAGKKVLVIDDAKPFTASKVASGIINPVTGRRIVKTWMIDELLPFAFNAYTQIGKELNTTLISPCNILDFHPTLQMQEAFAERLKEEDSYLHIPPRTEQWQQYFRFNYGVGEIAPCLLVDMQTLLQRWRKKLRQSNCLLEENFNWQNCKVESDHVTCKNIRAEKIICCEGVAGIHNPYFNLLPYATNKGEAIIAYIPGLPRTNIYKQGISIVPWKEDLFWIGSTYEWNYTNLLPTSNFLKKTEQQLNYWLKLPYKIIDHFASKRPANIERRPFVGLHPLHSSVGILNGMGAKGCSLAPYFAKELAAHLIYKKMLTPEADVQRFSRVLSRK